jgi:hypothetical protein
MSSLFSSFPDSLQSVLNYRSLSHKIPIDIERVLNGLPQILKARAMPSATRFSNMNLSGKGMWRGSSIPVVSDDGFETVTRRRPMPSSSTPVSRVESGISLSGMVSSSSDSALFTSANVKASGDVEDRMLARIKGKINKIGYSTYDSTKAFMQQILSGDETDFLDEFIKFVFQKAATEPAYCSLYARLLHELADEFTHIRTVMHDIFRTYMDIFTEVSVTPVDTTASEYKAFVEAQERKKFRHGYSQFVAELVKLNEAPTSDFGTMIGHIVKTLETLSNNNTMCNVSEEYVDCLSNMCLHASSVLIASDWSPSIASRISNLSKQPKTSVPGFSNKARFALMDLSDYALRGWK